MSASAPLLEMHRDRWNASPGPEEQAAAIAAVEAGSVLFFRNCSRGWHFLVARWGWM
jgi:hypothetical protein